MVTGNEPWKSDYIEACSYFEAREYQQALLKAKNVVYTLPYFLCAC